MENLPRTAGDWARALFDAFSQESDRAAAIVAGAMLDDALLKLLKARLVVPDNEERSILDGVNAPLGTFSARIDGALQLGLVSTYLARDLHLIRKIRNAFAHEPLETTFDTQRIADLVSAVEAGSDYNTRHPETRQAMGPASKKGDFLGIVGWILYTIHSDAETIERVEPARPEFGYLRFEDLPPLVRELLRREGAA